ncbi:MAG: hypothetical protein PHI55_11910 [Burkholderiaceae bacterium]|nr:hypothetical protein [Burkholderiaceae bacterium]
MTPIAIATEDELSEAVALRLVAEVDEPHEVKHLLRRNGFGYLRSRMDSWCQMAQRQVVLVVTDLDQGACPVALSQQWLAGQPTAPHLVLRVAVREVESWVLADHKAMRELIGPRGTLPPQPDELPDPKQALLRLAKGAPRAVRNDLFREMAGQPAQGLGYNARLTAWVRTQWNPEQAAERSPSLARARKRLQQTVRDFAQAS